MKKSKGKVFLVGAGPGDPGLVTLKAVESLRRADLIFYDALANEALLQFADPRVKILYVGKRGASHALEQSEIERRMVEAARAGKVVVRLKGGDPFVFGRGGEECEALAVAGVDFEVVPGISSAIAAPAYAGIPVTHRDFSSSFAVVTGHGADDEAVQVNWTVLAGIDTVVFLMGVSTLPTIVEKLQEAGRSETTPVAVVQWGTWPRQRTVTGTLGTIVEEVKRRGLEPPAVTVVGEVVRLRDQLNWFERKPLWGRRILVTRSREQASAVSKKLEEEGAEVIEIPTIEILPPANGRGLDRAIASLSQYDWLIFTSVNGVDFFFRRLQEKRRDLRDLKGIKIAAIGPATAQAVREKGIRVDSIAEEYRAEGLVKIMKRSQIAGRRILIPRAREARDVLVKELRRLKAKVDVVEAYRSVVPREGAAALKKAIGTGLDLITFASSSTVENFVRMLGVSLRKTRRVPVASIGPITTQTAKRHRLKVVIQPKSYTIPALVESVVRYFQK